MNTYSRIISFVCIVLCASCASLPDRPRWIDADTDAYRSNDALLGRGDGTTLAQAQDRARAEIAKVFSVKVGEDSSDVQRFESGKTSGAETHIERSLTTHTAQILSGARIAESWQDPTSHRYYVLAVLPRLQAASALRQDINDLDAATRRLLEKSRDATDPLTQLAYAEHAVRNQEARLPLQQDLRVVDPSGRGLPAEWPLERLRSDAQTLRLRLRIAVSVAPNSPPTFADQLAGALAQQGYTPAATDSADYLLNGTLQLAEPMFREGWYWVTGTLDVQLLDARTRHPRAAQHWAIKGSAQETARAQQRARDNVIQVLKELLPSVLLSGADVSAGQR